MRPTAEEIKAVLDDYRPTEWPIAEQALKDAAKQLKPKKGQPAPTPKQILTLAKQLVREPARQPEAVKALKDFKKQSKLPIKTCREIMARANYDLKQAFVVAEQSGHELEAPAPKLRLTVVGGLAVGPHLLVLARRTSVLNAAQKREQKDLRRNGEYVDTPSDVTLLCCTGGSWRRLGPHQRTAFDVVRLDDTVHAIQSFRDVTRIHAWNLDDGTSSHEDVATLLGSLCSGTTLSGTRDTAFMRYIILGSPRVGDGLWAVVDGSWTEIPDPPGRSNRDDVIPLGSNADGIWASTRQFVGHWNGSAWVEVACVPHESGQHGAYGFTELAFGPGGAIAGAKDGDVWFGTASGLSCAWHGLAAQHLIFFGDQLACAAPGRGLMLGRPDAPPHCVLESRTTVVPFVGDDRLYATVGKKLQHTTDGTTWSPIDVKPLFASLGHADLWWTTEKPLG